jgi:hypothetical protein
MKKRVPGYLGNLMSPVFLVIFAISLITMPACNNSGDSKDNKNPDSLTASSALESIGDVSIYCITLTRDQIKMAWVDSGWTTPGDPDLIVWVKFLTSYSGSGSDFNVTAYGTEADTVTITNSDERMNQGASCPVTMPSGINYGPNFFKLSDLGILNTDGTLKSFDYIRLTPQVSSDSGYANFSVEVVTRSGAEAKGSTNPCPPPHLCPPF